MEDFDNETEQLRIKQSKCKHTCFVCPMCKLYKDNLHNEQQIIIETLKAEISRLNFLLENDKLNI